MNMVKYRLHFLMCCTGYLLFSLLLVSCGSGASGIVPQISLPLPENDGAEEGLTISAPDLNENVLVQGPADLVPEGMSVVAQVVAPDNADAATSDEELCIDEVPACPEMNAAKQCGYKLAGDTISFEVPAQVQDMLVLNYYDDVTCSGQSVVSVQVQEKAIVVERENMNIPQRLENGPNSVQTQPVESPTAVESDEIQTESLHDNQPPSQSDHDQSPVAHSDQSEEGDLQSPPPQVPPAHAEADADSDEIDESEEHFLIIRPKDDVAFFSKRNDKLIVVLGRPRLHDPAVVSYALVLAKNKNPDDSSWIIEDDYFLMNTIDVVKARIVIFVDDMGREHHQLAIHFAEVGVVFKFDLDSFILLPPLHLPPKD